MAGRVLSFGELEPEQRSSAGGKGGTLSRLFREGYPVPDGFVILSTAYDEDEISSGTWSQVQIELERLRNKDAGISFAVRSSAVAEDSVLASFAGEFETVVDVSSDEEISSAIKKVRRSRHNERVVVYSREHDIPEVHEMAVVVQRFIRADISGVLFTADPVSGNRSLMIGNYVCGAGDKLVSGETGAADFTFPRFRYRYSGPPELRRYARRLYKLAVGLEKKFACPQDIEWAVAGGRVYILQSRPITTMTGYNPVTGEYNDSLTGDYSWSCVNVGEATPDVMTPYTWSLYRMTYDSLIKLGGHSMVGNIGGRIYQNSNFSATLLKAIGQNLEEMAAEFGGAREEYVKNLDAILTPLPGVTRLSMLPGVFRLTTKMVLALMKLKRFVVTNPEWCRGQYRRIKEIKNREELVILFNNELTPYILDAFIILFAVTYRHTGTVGKIRKQLLKLVEADEADTLLSGVSSDEELLASLGPVTGLSRVIRGEMTREEYLENWGHRGVHEGEISEPRPMEDPAWLDRQLKAFAEKSVDIDALLDAQRKKFDAAWERLRRRYPSKAGKIRKQLKKAAEMVRLREATRSELTRAIWTGRNWVLQAGRLTEMGDDLFFLTYEEILELLKGNDAATVYIPARRLMHKKYKSLPPYPLIIRGRFDPFRWAADPDRSASVFDAHGELADMQPKSSSENIIIGMPGASGRVEGKVRKLGSPEEGDRLEPGEIIVAVQTNIGWTLLFPGAGGIVTDVGAPLSHAAIVAREMGIPAVLNCGDATERLHTGDRVRIDGMQGTVEILETVTE